MATAPQLRFYTARDIDALPQLQALPAVQRLDMKAVATVLPFRVNRYVIEQLIDWSNIPADPIFQLTFPQRGMLREPDFKLMRELIAKGAPQAEIQAAAEKVQRSLNPHPSGQINLNVPLDPQGKRIPGMQHKYRETVLFFPMAGQTCHSYCQYCFRWAQFVGLQDLKFAAREAEQLVEYLKRHKEVTSVLFTGGDPMVMGTPVLRRYLEPLLGKGLEHIQSIRIGTKAPAYWPYRYTSDADADDLLRLHEQVQASGRTMALMVHYCHPRELQTEAAQAALKRIRDSGAEVRCQAPLIRHINDDAETWRELWDLEVRLGAHPYYMFVERDTGARGYFELPLVKAYEIYSRAYRSVTGLARTVRGPVMSCMPGKVLVDDVTEVNGEPVIVLKMIQGRNPEWVNRTFMAKRDDKATWLDQLQPAGKPWFFGDELQQMIESGNARPWERVQAR
jgi:KamA family protein